VMDGLLLATHARPVGEWVFCTDFLSLASSHNTILRESRRLPRLCAVFVSRPLSFPIGYAGLISRKFEMGPDACNDCSCDCSWQLS
jgi:hypothetical protein